MYIVLWIGDLNDEWIKGHAAVIKKWMSCKFLINGSICPLFSMLCATEKDLQELLSVNLHNFCSGHQQWRFTGKVETICDNDENGKWNAPILFLFGIYRVVSTVD